MLGARPDGGGDDGDDKEISDNEPQLPCLVPGGGKRGRGDCGVDTRRMSTHEEFGFNDFTSCHESSLPKESPRGVCIPGNQPLRFDQRA